MFSASGSRSRWIAGALLICASIWFAGLEYRGLFVPDEGRYADIAREMLDADDWVTPRLNGIKYLEKPRCSTGRPRRVLGARRGRVDRASVAGLHRLPRDRAHGVRRISPCAPLVVAPDRADARRFLGIFLGSQFLTWTWADVLSDRRDAGFLLSRRTGIPLAEERGWMIFAWAGWLARS